HRPARQADGPRRCPRLGVEGDRRRQGGCLPGRGGGSREGPERGGEAGGAGPRLTGPGLPGRRFGPRQGQVRAGILAPVTTRIAILASGAGTNARALLDACRRGELGDATVVAVLADKAACGALAVRDALAWGVKVTGTTVHFADEHVDHGPIVAQECVPVLPGDDEETLHGRIKAVEHRLYPEAVRLVVSGRTRISGRRVEVG